jgi:hypothetical protein
MVAPQQLYKKIKGQGLHISLHNGNCQFFYNICQHIAEFGVLFGLYIIKCKIGKTIAKEEGRFGFNVKGNYFSKVTYELILP